ncbi:(2Fe-2S)-binding protein [Cognatishimia sp. SS12]|uniref:(2Fe-2S)-binding protein n=1 Tax=Cognatishimia sp. SS12 TaxID=2979465 RepID=UPI00232BB401|nr:(2Fe-2S)-binding protein [Cognatishimia sp. SS12]MDC0738059.1 (2Fe-2S)-binding protein [Cognatishimia sp. SS12]
MITLNTNVNGEDISRSIEGSTLLIHFLRNELGLTGTHEGCDSGHCGACTVTIDGQTVKSCMVLAASTEGGAVTTIEGIAKPSDLHPMQSAFNDHHGLQCGFCTPGMVVTAIDMVERYQKNNKLLDEDAIRQELTGNICRCTGYQNIVAAIQDGAARMQEGS